MLPRLAFASLLLFSGTLLSAEDTPLAFKPSGEGLFEFATGKLQGRLKVDGKYQGLYPLIDSVSGEDLTNPPGVFSYYRVFSSGRRYGDAARDWPTHARLLADGAVEVVWPAAEEHPLEITAVYRWTAADTLDVTTTVRPKSKLPALELFVSNYFTKRFRAAVYCQEPDRPEPGFLPADRNAEDAGAYVMFPRDEQALAMIRDGRWTIPPSPVDWDVRRWLAAPLAMRRDTQRDLTALLLCEPDACFAVSTPWNPPAEEAAGYRSLYVSLYGRDLEAEQAAQARCRLIIRRSMSDADAVRCYEQFLAAPRG